MATLSTTELEKIKAKHRHEEMVAAMRSLSPDNSHLEKLIADGFAAVKTLASRDNAPDMKPLIEQLTKGLAEMKQIKEPKPKSFSVVRDAKGLIEKVVVNI